MGEQEHTFERRMRKIFSSKGYLVIKCAASRPFDIILIRNQKAYPIEVKGKDTPYPRKQREEQNILSVKSNSCFFVIRQSKKKGKMRLYGKLTKYYHQLAQDLEEYLE